jgi:hypothetical protein
VKLKGFFFTSVLLFLALPSQIVAQPGPRVEVPLQRFVCNTGYTLEECHVQMMVLRKALAKYPAAQLGTWTWVLVRSKDWKRILQDRGLYPNSPAFSFLPRRETFIEEALVASVSARAVELREVWGMSIKDLLDLAVAHELGHAICNETDEAKTNRVTKMLRDGNAMSCGANLDAKNQVEKMEKLR